MPVKYGLGTLVVSPHLSPVARPTHHEDSEDQQKSMDLDITIRLADAVATGATAVLMSGDQL